ncbi:MAG: portal protein [Hyphomicrobium sp.]
MADERQDEKDAFQKARLYHSELDEIYKYFMPYRPSTTQRSADGLTRTEGASRTDHLFDGTGLHAAFNFAGLMQADWMPPFQDFFKIEAGPLVAQDERKQLNEALAHVTEMAHGVLPRVRVTAHEMFGDLFAGTGAMYLSSGTDREPVRGQAVPINEIACEDGPFGTVESVWWRRNYKARHIPEAWPKAKIGDDLNRKINENRNADILITQSTRYDAELDRYVLRVYCDHNRNEELIWREETRTNPWQIVRFFKVPGEAHGRGLGHFALPFQKTANKTRELALRAAAFALMGIWMRRNDGVFNPDTAVFQPLKFWTVGSTGGPLGPTLQRLPVPQDFDVASIVLKDEREQINKVTLNDELPELQDSVRSPTEIAARLRRVAKSRGGASARISLELVAALAQRTVEILENKGLVETRLSIDQLLAKTTVTAPAAAAQRADKVQWAVDWMQMIVGLAGPQSLPMFAKVQDLLPDVGRWMGVDERYIPSKADQKEFMDVVKAIAAQQQQAAAPPPAPGAQLVNGGAH